MRSLYYDMRRCYRKARFSSPKAAEAKIREIISKGGPVMTFYDCSNCGCFHLTKNLQAKGKLIT